MAAEAVVQNSLAERLKENTVGFLAKKAAPVVLALTVFSGASCDPQPPVEKPIPAPAATKCNESLKFAGEMPDPNSDQPKIVFVGDSLLAGPYCRAINDETNNPVNDAFRDFDYNYGIAAATGNNADPKRVWSSNEQWIAALPERAVDVIALGTNDAKKIADAPETGSVAQVIEQLEFLANVSLNGSTKYQDQGQAEHLVFMTVDTTNSAWGPENAAAINDWIRNVQTYGAVADWDAMAQLHPGYFPNSNDPHTTAAGDLARIQLIEDTIDSVLEPQN